MDLEEKEEGGNSRDEDEELDDEEERMEEVKSMIGWDHDHEEEEDSGLQRNEWMVTQDDVHEILGDDVSDEWAKSEMEGVSEEGLVMRTMIDKGSRINLLLFMIDCVDIFSENVVPLHCLLAIQEKDWSALRMNRKHLTRRQSNALQKMINIPHPPNRYEKREIPKEERVIRNLSFSGCISLSHQ